MISSPPPNVKLDGVKSCRTWLLAKAINGVIARRRLNQAAAAEKLGINQPKVSALANYKLDGFSWSG